jgi:two-component system, LytTR family, response regulator
MILNCLVVDDDALSRSVLEDLINDTEFLTLAKSCENAMEAVSVLNDSHIDILFLDIEMPKMDGMELIKSINPLPQLILVTSHAEYAVESYEYNVTDFIVKPVSPARFIKAVDKARKNLESKKASISTSGESMFIKTDSKLVQLSTDEILFIEALGNYMRIYTSKGKYTILSTMKDMETKLPANHFARVHRSFIVNIKKIETIEDNFILIDGKQVSIGKAYKEELEKRLNLL